MLINLRTLADEGEHFEGRLPSGVLAFASDDPLYAETEGIAFAVHAQALADTLLVRGTVSVVLQACCVRCCTAFPLTVRDPAFVADWPLTDVLEEVDLTPALREAILLALPSHPVCGTDCRGLCPRCGINRNRETCACAPPADSRWTALDGLNNASSSGE